MGHASELAATVNLNTAGSCPAISAAEKHCSEIHSASSFKDLPCLSKSLMWHQCWFASSPHAEHSSRQQEQCCSCLFLDIPRFFISPLLPKCWATDKELLISPASWLLTPCRNNIQISSPPLTLVFPKSIAYKMKSEQILFSPDLRKDGQRGHQIGT